MSDLDSPTPNLPGQPLFDLTGMSPQDAKSYVLSLATHLKKTELDLQVCETDLAQWTARAKLAVQKGMVDLQAQATARVQELTGHKTKLEMEVWEFRDGVAKLKKDLLLLPLTQRTVNTEALQQGLNQLAGEPDAVTPAVKSWQAEDALAALKKKISG
ncbi:MAG: hypothetical protein WCG80_11935 [Spirochaetales bacterium]